MIEGVVEENSRAGASAGVSGSRLDRLAGLALVAGLALAAFLLWRAAVLRPFSDVLDWIVRDEQFRAGGGLAHYLLAPHNTHRLVWTLALLDLDIRLFAGSGWPLIVSGALGLAASAWLLTRASCRGAPSGLQVPLAAAAALLALGPANIMSAALPIFTEYLHTLPFGLLALTLAEAGDEAPRGWRAAGVLACVVVAALGNAVGLAFLPALAYGALVRREWRWLALVAGFGAVFGWLYFHDAHGTSGGAGIASSIGRLGASLALGLSVLGLPWSRAAVIPGMAIGALVLGLALAALTLRAPSPTARLAQTMIVFSLATAAMAALGRADQGVQAPVRYAVFMTPAHVGLLILAAPLLGRLQRARPLALRSTIAGLLGVLLLQAMGMSVMAIRACDNIRTLIAEFDAGRRTPPMTVLIHPDLNHAAEVFRRLRSEGLYQHELHLPSSPA